MNQKDPQDLTQPLDNVTEQSKMPNQNILRTNSLSYDILSQGKTMI